MATFKYLDIPQCDCGPRFVSGDDRSFFISDTCFLSSLVQFVSVQSVRSVC